MESSGLRTGAMPAIDLGSARPEEIKEADISEFQGLLHCQEDAVLPGPFVFDDLAAKDGTDQRCPNRPCHDHGSCTGKLRGHRSWNRNGSAMVSTCSLRPPDPQIVTVP
jgi:hypothetical protein